MGCPLIVYTDLDISFCKAIEEGQLARPEPSSRALDPAIGPGVAKVEILAK
jgi:hypothetical protein